MLVPYGLSGTCKGYIFIIVFEAVEVVYMKPRARILKHLLEAEKSTFREELSFQRSESTKGLFQATVFV